ncbi:thiosulfate dehydrogenase [quinone] large subunit [Isoptericola jiangsuensis]|uniref:Thiosulfate dehydrogenase [quinone] large subunit n=1 Tax=Isoptericola jiangsuensis TaxID=548579 RepID=A0A2A9EXU5_9MICO|nr:DoxX family protein [Isoptericola jiangsuensis]PFG43563.1 thiosulfate dehydrogenase [quinone] large subunit [Isoptericola jiangsuensis]
MSTYQSHHETPAVPGTASGDTDVGTSPGARQALRYVGAVIRICLGWVFLWAFLDKAFGLGHETPAEGAWIDGGQPTAGFLGHATAGPFADFYQGLAGQAWADWVFMIGLLGIGVALLLGIGMRIAATAGALMLVLMWTAVLPPANNPFMDDHLIYALVLVALALGDAGRTLGLGGWWQQTPWVRRWPVLV